MSRVDPDEDDEEEEKLKEDLSQPETSRSRHRPTMSTEESHSSRKGLMIVWRLLWLSERSERRRSWRILRL